MPRNARPAHAVITYIVSMQKHFTERKRIILLALVAVALRLTTPLAASLRKTLVKLVRSFPKTLRALPNVKTVVAASAVSGEVARAWWE